MISKIPFLVGHVTLQSNLSLEEVGQILSEKIFGGLQFGGKELAIHEEVPAIFIDQQFMGLQVVLDGYSGLDNDSSFELSIHQVKAFEGLRNEAVNLDDYLTALLNQRLDGKEGIYIR